MNRPPRTVMGAARPAAAAGLRALAVVVLGPALVACSPATPDASPAAPDATSSATEQAPGSAADDDASSPGPTATDPATSGGSTATEPDATEAGGDADAGGGDGASGGGSAADDRAPADVVIAFSGWSPDATEVQVGAFVADVIEDGGVCTLRLVRGDRTATAEAGGVADATLTGCGALAVDGAALSAGRWTATVEYSSNTSTGVSAPVEIEVP